MNELKFTYNWNNKLDCKCFTTIRLSEKYKVGDEYKIILQTSKNLTVKGVAVIISIKPFSLDKLNEFMSYLDTGYSVEECTKIIMRMYNNAAGVTQNLKFILLKYK